MASLLKVLGSYSFLAMLYLSTKNPRLRVTVSEAVLCGLASDGGLFMPESVPWLGSDFFATCAPRLSLQQIACRMLSSYFEPEFNSRQIGEIVSSAFNFPCPIIKLSDSLFALELFHGPTLAFKDFGARFMAGVLSSLLQRSQQNATVLVATSGDTGSAVANAFFNCKNVRVVVLYPKGRVSKIQEMQMTTLGGNIHALEVEGSFDDCQRMVKEAFRDQSLSRFNLTSANSINIARFIPQMVYYAYAFSRLATYRNISFSVPSGNFGNLCAGLLAKRMGLPAKIFFAATNINDAVPRYLESGVIKRGPSKITISNAMDVGDPSNFSRIEHLYPEGATALREDLCGGSFTDKETVAAIRELYNRYCYHADPHAAVGYLGAQKLNHAGQKIFLATASPYKFGNYLACTIKSELPTALNECLKRKKKSTSIGADSKELKNYIINRPLCD